MRRSALTAGLALVLPLSAQPQPPAATQSPPRQPAARRTRLGAAAMRNENVAVQPIDNYAVRESNIRLGANVTLITDAPVETNFYAAEHGRPPSEALLAAAPQRTATPAAWHGELFDNHQNGFFNARVFFRWGACCRRAETNMERA